jgi:ferredoxin
MPHVVTNNCGLCRFTDCVTVCPVECFQADEERTYVDPHSWTPPVCQASSH